MTDSSTGTRESVSRFASSVERRAPESPPWSASLGGLLLGGAMLYHVSVDGEKLELPTYLGVGTTASVTLTPVQAAVLVVAGIGTLALAGWIRVAERKTHALLVTASGALVSIGYLLALHEFTMANSAYPLLHSFRATVTALVLFLIALVSYVSDGTWREPRGPILRILVGPDPRRTAQWGVVCGILLLVAAGGVASGWIPMWALTPFAAFEVIGERPVLGTLLVLGWFALAAIPGYRAEGLVSSWGLVFGPVFAAIVTHSATDQSVMYRFEFARSILEVFWWLVVPVIGIALLVGTFGYLLGAGSRRINISIHRK